MKEAVAEQENLLAEFQKISEELSQLLATLEGTTFVKRLKSLARKHTKLSDDIKLTTIGSFGDSLEEATLARANLLSDRELSYSDKARYIREDMEAYVNRVNKQGFPLVLEEMEELLIEKEINLIAAKIPVEPGISQVKTERVADVLDRWAEMLVPRGGT